jgi:phosphoribosylformimino-5-aminoimidazole carboxamide ribotide isomerase
MRVIPVIDLNQGRVVHAVAGQREHYRPVSSRLCPGSDPVGIVQAFLDIYSFDTVYMADLDAIAGSKSNANCLQRLLDTFPHLNFWLDQGINNKAEVLKAMHPRIQHVIGSETGFSPALLPELLSLSPQPILSLDFREGKFLGNQDLLQQPEFWPDNIILMNLDRVGTTRGVDENLLAQILKTTVHSHVFVGGGIRDISDMQHLHALGITGILVATALHTGQITSADLKAMARVNGKKMPR